MHPQILVGQLLLGRFIKDLPCLGSAQHRSPTAAAGDGLGGRGESPKIKPFKPKILWLWDGCGIAFTKGEVGTSSPLGSIP